MKKACIVFYDESPSMLNERPVRIEYSWGAEVLGVERLT